MYRFYCDFASHFIHFRAEKAKKKQYWRNFYEKLQKKPLHFKIICVIFA